MSASSRAISRAAGSAKAKAICSPTWSRSVTARGRHVVHVEARRIRRTAAAAAAADFHCAVRSGPRRSAVPGSSGKTFSSDVSSFSAIASASRPVSSSNQSSSAAVRSSRVFCAWSRGGVVLRLGALEQRIALDLLVDEALEFEMGELQQLDRLHQLRRHHQRLGLSAAAVWPSAPWLDTQRPATPSLPARASQTFRPGIETGPAFACQGNCLAKAAYRSVMAHGYDAFASAFAAKSAQQCALKA